MSNRRTVIFALVGLLIFLTICVTACGGRKPQGTTSSERISIRVLFAGSLIIPFDQLKTEFEKAHPDIEVNMEGHGSIQVIRYISDLQEQVDVAVTADHSLIPMLLYSTEDPNSGRFYADWYIIFATNEMALAYTENSSHATEITSDNWVEFMNHPGVRVGAADPRIDANGYRALMAVKLAERVYDRPNLFYDTFGTEFRVPIRVAHVNDMSQIKVPEILETKKGAHIVLRPYSVQLLPLLQTGEIDYAFEYMSVIEQHGLRCVTFPNEINLSDPASADEYARVEVALDFQRFASVKPQFTGEPIRYAATIPTNAGHPEAAETFLTFLLGSEGQRIMAENHQPTISPALADNFEALPATVRAYCVPLD
ncbi:MAG: tungstate ABC transporter substrate-binding protein WtpA [Actinobacteria bacterium]|nr:tungstate ABC transporter substrate-binding protein WtpA [Actinomycetota bacterium]